MEFYEVEKINNWYFKIKLPYVERSRVSYNNRVLKYVYCLGRYVYDYKTEYLYNEEDGDGEFIFQIGFASVVYNEFYEELNNTSRELLEDMIFSKIKIPHFQRLYDYQNEDLQQLTSLNRGIFQCYTGYGKSEIIAVLTDYILNTLHEKVLIVTPTSASLNEIRDRIYSISGVLTEYYNPESDLNILNLNGFLRSKSYNKDDEYWKNKFWILADEVEYCCSDSAMNFYENLSNVTHIYGFSATAEKQFAIPFRSRVPDEFLNSDEMKRLREDRIDPINSKLTYLDKLNKEKSKIRDLLGANQYLIGYFGTTVVYKKPGNFKITLVNVKTTYGFKNVSYIDMFDFGAVFNVFKEDNFCKLIQRIVFKEGMMFIPMVRLEIIDFWVANYFKKDDFIVLVICGRGYELYENGEFLSYIGYDEMKKMISDGIIGVILGTKSAFNAIDLHGLTKVMMLFSNLASIVIQSIGRALRQKECEIFSIVPMTPIKFYSKDLEKRLSLLKSYYSDCIIREKDVLDNYYD